MTTPPVARRRIPKPPKPAPSAATAPLKPAATVSTMIVCLPDGLPRESLTTGDLARSLGVAFDLQARFWTTPKLHLWQRGQMFGLRKGSPAFCVGGPVRLLNLAGLRYAGGVAAGIWHQQWTQAVQGTRPALPWVQFHTKHLNDPSGYPADQAAAEFWAQPRVTAMRMYNAGNAGAQLPIDQLEMLQAGYAAYQHYGALTAICGDAVHDPRGNRLAPATDAFADRVTYLDEARRCLDNLDPDQRIVAVTLR